MTYTKRNTAYWDGKRAKHMARHAADLTVYPPEIASAQPTDHALVLSVPDNGSPSAMLEGIYRDVPGVVVRACETRRVGIQFGTVRLLIDVRDLLIPYRRFGAWCEACGFQYNSVKTAIRRYELLLLESGQALTRANGTPIKPRTRQNEPSEQERAAWKPLTLVLCRDEFVSEQMFNSGFVRWLNRQTTQDGYQDKLRARCLQLAGYLIRAARTRTIESTSDE